MVMNSRISLLRYQAKRKQQHAQNGAVRASVLSTQFNRALRLSAVYFKDEGLKIVWLFIQRHGLQTLMVIIPLWGDYNRTSSCSQATPNAVSEVDIMQFCNLRFDRALELLTLDLKKELSSNPNHCRNVREREREEGWIPVRCKWPQAMSDHRHHRAHHVYREKQCVAASSPAALSMRLAFDKQSHKLDARSVNQPQHHAQYLLQLHSSSSIKLLQYSSNTNSKL